MGALRGSIGYTKFHVRGALPAQFADTFVEALQLRRFRPLAPHDEDEVRVGWVSIHDPLDLELTHEKVFLNEYLNVGLRIDRYRIPTALLKAHVAEAERARREETGQERLSKVQRADVKAMVVRRLRESTLPTMRVVDLSWNLNQGAVRFFSHAKATFEPLEELFDATFRLALVQDGAYVRAENAGLPAAALDTLVALEPTPFHFEPTR